MDGSPKPPPLSARERLGLVAATAIGLGLRLLWVLKIHPPSKSVFSDMGSYVERAKHLALGYYAPGDWIYPPGTPGPIALWMKLTPNHWETAAALMQALMATAEIPLLFIAARRWFGNRIALAAAASYAVYYPAIDYVGLFSSENYLTFGLILAVAFFDPERPLRTAWSGVGLGLGAIAKPQAMLLAPLWFALLLLRRKNRTAAALTVACTLMVMPLSYLCSKATGQVQFLSTAGGVVMVQAWCPVKDVDAHGPGWQMGFGLPTVAQRDYRGEVESTWGHAKYNVPFIDSRFYMHEGLGCIARFPKHALRTLVLNFWDTFGGPPWSYQGPWPDASTDWRKPTLLCNLFVSWLVLPFTLLGIWRYRRLDGMHWVVSLPLLSCVLNCLIFHGEPRFRVPYDFTLLLGACAGIASLMRKAAPIEVPLATPMPLPEAPPAPAATGTTP